MVTTSEGEQHLLYPGGISDVREWESAYLPTEIDLGNMNDRINNNNLYFNENNIEWMQNELTYNVNKVKFKAPNIFECDGKGLIICNVQLNKESHGKFGFEINILQDCNEFWIGIIDGTIENMKEIWNFEFPPKNSFGVKSDYGNVYNGMKYISGVGLGRMLQKRDKVKMVVDLKKGIYFFFFFVIMFCLCLFVTKKKQKNKKTKKQR